MMFITSELIYFIIIIYIVSFIIGGWEIIRKTGGYSFIILIPLLNLIAIFNAAGKPWWWLFLLFIPIVNLFVPLIILHSLAKQFNKNLLFSFGLVIIFPVFWLIMAFSKYNKNDN